MILLVFKKKNPCASSACPDWLPQAAASFSTKHGIHTRDPSVYVCLPPGLLRALSGVTYPKVKPSFLSKEFAPDPGFPVTGKQHLLLKPEPGCCLITNILDNALPVHLNSVSLFLVCKIGIEISTSYLIGLLRIK